MQILVNLFHPNLEKSIVNRRWLNELEQHSQRSESRISASAASESAISESAISESAASNGENSHAKITINQVYSEYPDGVINVAREQQLLEAHDRIVFQHPFLWYSVPALMKQWMDDVLTYGWAYGPGGTALHGKDWVSVISTGGPKRSYQAGGFNNFSMSEFLKPMQQTANLIGANYLAPFLLHGAVQAKPEDIDASVINMISHITNPELDAKLRLKRLLGELNDAGTTMDH